MWNWYTVATVLTHYHAQHVHEDIQLLFSKIRHFSFCIWLKTCFKTYFTSAVCKLPTCIASSSGRLLPYLPTNAVCYLGMQFWNPKDVFQTQTLIISIGHSVKTITPFARIFWLRTEKENVFILVEASDKPTQRSQCTTPLITPSHFLTVFSAAFRTTGNSEIVT